MRMQSSRTFRLHSGEPWGFVWRYLVVPLAWAVVLKSGERRGGGEGGGELGVQGGGVLAFDGCKWDDDGGVVDLSSLASRDGTPR